MTLEIVAVIGLVLMGIILGRITKGKEPIDIYWDYDLKTQKLASLETAVYRLESENNRLNHIVENLQLRRRCFEEQYYAHCRQCNKNFYSKDMDGQKIADMLKTISLTTDNLAEKLDIKIT